MEKLEEFLDDIRFISKMGDYPGADDGLTTEQFKARFDEAGIRIQRYINEILVPTFNSFTGEGAKKTDMEMNGFRVIGLADPQELDDAANKGYVDALVREELKKRIFNANATVTANWTGDGPFTQTISCIGILNDDIPDIWPDYSDDQETCAAQVKTWAAITKIKAGNGVLYLRCNKKKPTAELPLQVRVVR